MTYFSKRGSKYGAKKTVTGGRKYDSKFEAGVAKDLELRRLAGQVKEVRPQVTLKLMSYGHKVCGYRIDFVVKVEDGVYELIEAKGFATPDWKLKWRILELCVNEADFRDANGFDMDDELKLVLITR